MVSDHTEQREDTGAEGQRGAVLPDVDQSVLDFEGSWWLYPGPKDRAITEYLDMSATRYYQAIRRLIDDDQALTYAPLAVRRLRKIRRTRLEQLAARVGDNG